MNVTAGDKSAFTQDWFSSNVPLWTQMLNHLAGRPAVRALEIGCFEGRATCWLLAHIFYGPDAGIDCIDTFEGSDEYGPLGIDIAGVRERFEANIAPWRERVHLYVGRSADVLRGLDGSYDLVYVDGSHAAADVITDAVLAWPRLAAGGVMIFDDYAWTVFARPERNPRLGVDAFRGAFAGHYELLHVGYQLAVRKLAAYSKTAAAAVLPPLPQDPPD